ncbi:MAG: SufD family Fe-S cluster assembly protein [Rickettsiales bacterium]|jgi:hypothetical protein|nr:SufD family Fe-S cluster assembly protein [Rickettsiales bacterium]
MSYLFDHFKNIRTFPANTRVYRDGVFAPELSSENEGPGLPLHIIHIGKITGDHNWVIDMGGPRDVFLTARIETEGAANISVEIDANLENMGFDGRMIVKNAGNLTLDVVGNNNKSGTRIRVETKLFADAGSESELRGLANIPADVSGAESDIGFSALCDPRAKSLAMSPAQRISSAPASAGHSASIYRPPAAQARYLETAGLTELESADLLNKVFLEEAV